ncbi:MAG: DUF1007 family protein [Nitratireductor sp.]
MKNLIRKKQLFSGFALLGALTLPSTTAFAHPHVFIEANLELHRDDDGNAKELRHVWKFDEIFSSSIVLDFDKNGDDALSVEELDEVASTIKTNLKDFEYFTFAKLNDAEVKLELPKHFFADYQDGQLILIAAMDFKKPHVIKGQKFSVAVSDPSYYVAVEFMDEKSIEISGGKNAGACTSEIERPDFDALYEQSPEVFLKDFEGSEDPDVFNSDDYLTWMHFSCA